MAETVDPKNVKAASDMASNLSSNLEKVFKVIQKINKEITKTGTETKKTSKYAIDLNEEWDDATELLKTTQKEMSLLNSDLEKANGFSRKFSKDTQKLVVLEKQRKKIAANIAAINSNKRTSEKTKVKEIKQQLTYVKEMRKQIAASKGGQKAPGKGVTGVTNFLDSVAAAPDALNVAGLAAKGLGKIVGNITGALGGWPGLIFSGVKAIWNMGMAADEFVKNANKRFAHVRGPDIMTADVAKQFRSFNDQIYNTGANLKAGLNAEEINGFMEAMSQAGGQITRLNSGLSSYRDAIYIASKASKTLGMELPQVGSIMTQMITNLRMDLKDIDKAFIEVAFDAKKSGLSTDRFWNTIQNANASLAMYGVRIGAASKTMTRFTKDAIGGADDASKAVEDMYQIFKEGDIGKQAALMDLARQSGGFDPAKAIKEMVGERSTKLGTVRKDLGEARKSPAQNADLIKDLIAQESSLEDQIAQLGRGLTDKGGAVNSVLLAPLMGFFAEKAPEIFSAALKNAGGGKDLAKLNLEEQGLATKKLAGILSISESTAAMILQGHRKTKIWTDKTFPIMQKLKGDLAIGSEMWSLGTTQGEEQVKQAERLSQMIQDQTDIQKDQADSIVEMAKADPKIAEKLAAYINSGQEDDGESLKALLDTTETQGKLDSNKYKVTEKTEDELKALSKKTFENIRDQTLSYKEMQKIATDEVEWRLNNLKALTTLNDIAARILKGVTGEDYVSPEQLAQQTAEKTIGAYNDKLASLAEQEESLSNLEASFSASGDIGSALQGIAASGDYAGATVLKGSLTGVDVDMDKSIMGEYFKKKRAKLAEEIKTQTEMKQLTTDIQADGKVTSASVKALSDITKKTEAGSFMEAVGKASKSVNTQIPGMAMSTSRGTTMEEKALEALKSYKGNSYTAGQMASILQESGGDPELIKALLNLSQQGYAKGTSSAPGGLSLLHKNELLNIPSGSQVFTARQTEAMLTGLSNLNNTVGGGGAGGGTIQNNFNITGNTMDKVINQIRSILYDMGM